jgi:hydrogenase/urease accessory protein HupE
MKRAWAVICASLIFCLFATPAFAHGQRTAYVEADEDGAGHLTARIRLVVPAPSLALALEGCELAELTEDRRSLLRAYAGACTRQTGRTLRLSGLGPVIDGATVHLRAASGDERSGWLTQADPTMSFDGEAYSVALIARFARLGAEHLARGPDHLLFLLLIVLAVRRPRGVLAAETAFTVAHMTTFSLAACGLVRIPAAPVEVCIAMSILFLAVEVDLDRPLGQRRAATQAFVFGLFHGLGFAGGLKDLDVGDGAIAPALVGFGTGLELAQLAFALALLALVTALARSAKLVPFSRLALALAGGAGAYFCIERWSALL